MFIENCEGIKKFVICLIVTASVLTFGACSVKDSGSGENVPSDNLKDTSFSAETTPSDDSAVNGTTASADAAETLPATNDLPSETEAPTENASGSENPVETEAANEDANDPAVIFFNGTWNSTSKIIYIFNAPDRTVRLIDSASGEELLSGTYDAATEDFTEYELSMTFNGDTDEFIAWEYADTGSVALITKTTKEVYDNIWRA